MGKNNPHMGWNETGGGQPPTWKYSAQNPIKGGRNYNIKSQIIKQNLPTERGRGTRDSQWSF